MSDNNQKIIGKIKKISPRDIWEKEYKHFTPWLAKNIDYLNDVLNMDISVQTVEGNVGPYFVDIYGEDGSGNKIIIENQLEKSDHGHLGQILTYLVNLDANIAIWITTNPSEEHQKVIEWLNETTPENMSFYLVKIEAIKIEGHESVAPLFTVIEGPTEERKKIGAEKKEYAERHIVRKKFWTQFIEAMNKKNNLCQNVSPSTDASIGLALGTSGVGLNLVISKSYARAEIYINRGDIQKNKEVFDYFYNMKDKIEKDFGDTLVWERMDDRVTSRIKYQLDGVSVFNENDWPKMNDFMIDAASRLYKAFKEPVQKLRSK
jgi:RNA binding exosome subunit